MSKQIINLFIKFFIKNYYNDLLIIYNIYALRILNIKFILKIINLYIDFKLITVNKI